MNHTEKLAKHAANLRYEDIPAEVIAEMKTMILEYISVAFGSMYTESGKIAAEFSREFGENGKCTVIGYGYKTAPYNAAFSNAVMVHSIELDDVDHLALFRYGTQTISAALAMAEWCDANGKDFLAGLVAGCDIVTRVSEATNPSLRDRGFHTTPTCGVFGCGAAAGRVLGLDAKKMISVLGLSGAQACGLMEMYGVSMAKRFNCAPPARNGVVAALFAQRGFTGAETILEGERGFCRAFSDDIDLDALTRNLGSDLRIFVEYKPYSCARPIHNGIDCAINTKNLYNPNIDDIAKITIKRHPSWAAYHIINEPRTFHEAQMSLPYSAAVALVTGRAFYDQYSEENLKNERIMRLCRMIRIEPDDTLPRTVSCNMITEMKDGKVYQMQVDYPKGSIQNPFSKQDHINKFVALSEKVLTDQARQSIQDMINNIEHVKNMKEFTEILVESKKQD